MRNEGGRGGRQDWNGEGQVATSGKVDLKEEGQREDLLMDIHRSLMRILMLLEEQTLNNDDDLEDPFQPGNTEMLCKALESGWPIKKT